MKRKNKTIKRITRYVHRDTNRTDNFCPFDQPKIKEGINMYPSLRGGLSREGNYREALNPPQSSSSSYWFSIPSSSPTLASLRLRVRAARGKAGRPCLRHPPPPWPKPSPQSVPHPDPPLNSRYLPSSLSPSLSIYLVLLV